MTASIEDPPLQIDHDPVSLTSDESRGDKGNSSSLEQIGIDTCSVEEDSAVKEDSNTSVEEEGEYNRDRVVGFDVESVHEESSFDHKAAHGVTKEEMDLVVSSGTAKEAESDVQTCAGSADTDALANTEIQVNLQNIDISEGKGEGKNIAEGHLQNDACESSVASALPMEDMLLQEESGSLLERWQQTGHQSTNQSQITESEVDEVLVASQDELNDGNKLLRGWSRDENEEGDNVLKVIRKAGVAVTGGALVAVGLPMIPMPTPGGVVVVGSGMALLATEFPAAQRALDRSRQGLATLVGDDSDDDEDKVEKKKRVARVADLVFQDEQEAKKEAVRLRTKKLLNPIAAMKESKSYSTLNNKGVKEFKERTVNASNGAKKNVKRFIRKTVIPLMERMTSSSSSKVKLDRDRSRGNSSTASRLKQEGTLTVESESTHPDNTS